MNYAKIALYFIGIAAVFGCFFYFYPADIFKANIFEGELKYTLDISLRGFLDHQYLPKAVHLPKMTAVKLTWEGWAILIICLIGVPLMMAYRLAMPKTAPKEKTNNTEQ